MAHVATITIDHTKVPGDLTDYVGLIVPDGSAGYSALYALCLEGGGDIRLFKSDDTTELAREIVSFSVSAETGEIHYKYTGTLSSSVDTPIHVYADGSSSEPSAGATYGSGAVWANHLFVSHDGGLTDSTGNNSQTNQGSANETSSVQIGDKARSFTSDYIESDLNPRTEIGTGDFTLSSWFKIPQTDDRRTIIGMASSASSFNDAISFGVRRASEGYKTLISARAGTSGQASLYGTNLRDDTYHQLHATRAGTTANIYEDGAFVDSDTAADFGVDAGQFFQIGRVVTFDVLSGILDEVRVITSELAANWITTEYNNQNDYSTFYSVAAVAGSSAAQAARRGAVMMM